MGILKANEIQLLNSTKHMKLKIMRLWCVSFLMAAVILSGGCSDSDSTSRSSASHSEGESASSFIKRAVERGAGVAGSASVSCGSAGGKFTGQFRWRDVEQSQSFSGRVSGKPGNWHMDEFQMNNPR